jgi:taurine dioxygenase
MDKSKSTNLSKMEFKKVGPVGAEVSNIDLRELSEEQVHEIKSAFLEFSVLVFRGQELNPDNLKKISLIWGKPQVHPVFKGMEDFPEIIEIKNLGEKYHTNAHWHSDVTFEHEPPDTTLLYSLEVPDVGGDTLFSNQYQAYEELGKELKDSLESAKAIHSNLSVILLTGGSADDAKTVEHPIFRTHPETGKRALYVTEAFVQSIKGLDQDDSRKTLSDLYSHASQERFIYRHKWSNGDLVVWDNRSVQHFAEHGYGDKIRNMRRITTSGSKPF